MKGLYGVQDRAYKKLTRKWQTASALKERLYTMWALYQKGHAEIKVLAYCFQWRKINASSKPGTS
jgi:hypothetical protein